MFSIEALTCRAANQLTDVNQPDMVLLSIDPKVSLGSNSAMATLAEYGPYGLFVSKTLNADIDDTGSYEAVPNAEQWRVLNENVELGKLQELPSYCRQRWQILTGLTKPLDLSSPYLVNLDMPVRGNNQPSSSPTENIPPKISMAISDSDKPASGAENYVIITDPTAITPVAPGENPAGSIRNPYIWRSRINMPATGGISDTPKLNIDTRRDRAGLSGTSGLASDKDKAANSNQDTKGPQTGPEEDGQTGAEGV
jgi:hypothetical protein